MGRPLKSKVSDKKLSKKGKGGKELKKAVAKPIRRNKARDLTASEALQVAIDYMKSAGKFGKF